MNQLNETQRFPVNGQGTFIFTYNVKGKLDIYVTPERIRNGAFPDAYIKLQLAEGTAEFVQKIHGKTEQLVAVKSSKSVDVGVENNTLLSYWYSYDRDTCTVKYGKGFMMEQTTLMKYDFLEGLDPAQQQHKRKELAELFNAANPRYVMVFKQKEFSIKYLIDTYQCMRFRLNPLVGNHPPLVKDSSKVNLFDLDRSEYTFSKSLPGACQELFYNIQGCELENPGDPVMKLSDAIRYSIRTPEMCLNKIIVSKKSEFGDPSMVYLRVTLGPDVRTAPGIPYVLELWPSGCKSPIHNHGAACAVIKVLFGQIEINVYNQESSPPKQHEPIMQFDAKEGQVTWMDDNWYQCHQLKNNTHDFCATIQCYRYSKDDTAHWPGFDYIDGSDDQASLDTFYPNSDITFMKMREIVLEEFRQHIKDVKVKEQEGKKIEKDDFLKNVKRKDRILR